MTNEDGTTAALGEARELSEGSGHGEDRAASIRALGFEPGREQLYARRAAAWQDTGEIRHAVADCDAAIKLDPNATYYRMRGNFRNMQADLDGALADFDAAIALDPTFAAAYMDRGIARFLKNDVVGALADYDIGARLDPRQPSLRHMRALARRAGGDLAGAHEDLSAALHVDGETADIYNDRGRVSMESGDFAGACADYEAAGRLRPNWSQPHSNRGWALVLAGELDQALCAFSSALALEPADALALYGRQAVATRRSEAANGQADVGIAFINDPDIARVIAASGISPIADLAEVTSIEP
jgi:tetratricopeptide (TPR) repeat protein